MQSSHEKINKTLRDIQKKVEYHNQKNRILSPLSQLISGFGSISVVLSSSLISQTAAGNRGNLNKPFSRSKRPRFQNEAMSMVINVNFSYGRLNTRPRLKRTPGVLKMAL